MTPTRNDQREDLLGPPRVRRRLQEMSGRPLNFEPARLAAGPPAGWHRDGIRHALPGEPPGPPLLDGTFAAARHVLTGYEFADPSIVRAFYDPAHPLKRRTMLLRLRALGVFQVYVGVRILDVIDATAAVDGREVRIWGWRYGTLEGHVEQGEMSWEVWKWLDTGAVEFRIHAISRTARISNPLVAIGYRLFGPRERRAFLASTSERMTRFTELAMRHAHPDEIRDAAAELTARPLSAGDGAHDAVAAHGRRNPVSRPASPELDRR